MHREDNVKGKWNEKWSLKASSICSLPFISKQATKRQSVYKDRCATSMGRKTHLHFQGNQKEMDSEIKSTQLLSFQFRKKLPDFLSFNGLN